MNIAILLLALCCSSVLSQDVLTSGKVVSMVTGGLAPPFDIPSNIGLTISNRWMAVSFANGANVTDWVDVTNHFHWVKGIAPSTCTNKTGSGVRFDTDKFLDATNTFTDATLITFLIFTVDAGSGLNSTIAGYGTGAGQNFAVNVPASTRLLQFNVPTFPISDTVQQDIVFNNATLWTNGVDTTSVAPGAAAFTTTGVAIGATRSGGTSAWPMLGYLREWITFKETSATSVQKSNLHYYATHYPYTQ